MILALDPESDFGDSGPVFGSSKSRIVTSITPISKILLRGSVKMMGIRLQLIS